MKLSAHPETEYKGTVLMNPGGPGASGVVYLASIGSLLTSIIGIHYEIISVDPRGTGGNACCDVCVKDGRSCQFNTQSGVLLQ